MSNLDAQLRVGSIEIAVAFLAVAVAATRPRVRAAAEAGRLVPMQVALELYERGGAPRTYEGRPPLVIGRASDADVVVADSEVSRRHARLESRNGVVYVDDLGSRNGTFLNGRRVMEAIEVREGDHVDVGTTRVIVTAVKAL